MWIAQDMNGCISTYKNEPKIDDIEWLGGYCLGSLQKTTGIRVKNWEKSLINLETYDYKIEDGILIKLDKKSELEKLIARIAKIDPVAAKWLDDNKHMDGLGCDGKSPRDINGIDAAFFWLHTPQGHKFWWDIETRLKANEDKETTNRHKDEDAIIASEMQYIDLTGKNEWIDCNPRFKYRIKPKTKVVRFRVFIDNNGNPIISTEERPNINAVYVGNWQEIEINIGENDEQIRR